MQAGHIGQVVHRPAQLGERAVALAAVAVAAGGDAVHPGVAATARDGLDVFAGEVVEDKPVAAVGADLAVASEEFGVGQRGALAPGPAGDGAVHRDDGVQFQARLQAGEALDAPTQDHERVAQRPGDAVTGIQDRRFPGREPGLRTA